jgi:hypothetical protein
LILPSGLCQTSSVPVANGASDGQKGCDVERLICALEGVLDEFGGDAKSKLDALARLAAQIGKDNNQQGRGAFSVAAGAEPSAVDRWIQENGPTTRVQASILAALDGKTLGVEDLADACTNGDGSRLYREGLRSVLLKDGLVKHKRRVGYYRPDRPPREALPAEKTPRASECHRDAGNAYAPPPPALIERDADVLICRDGRYFRGYVEAVSFKRDESVCPPNGPPAVHYGDVYACIRITRPDPCSLRISELAKNPP